MLNTKEKSPIPAIFYGAGKWIGLNFLPIQRLGITPLCFVDDDMQKQGTTISFGKTHIQTYEILSLGDAVTRYPESKVLITVHPIAWELLEQKLLASRLVQREQILAYPADLQITRGCYDMQRRLEVRPTLAYCCLAMVDGENTVPLDLSQYEKTIEDFFAIRNRDIEDMKAGKIPERCRGCTNNIVDIWFDRPAVEEVAVSLAGRCQLNCVYCGGTDRAEFATNELTKKFELKKFMSILAEKNYIEDDAYLCIACGEPALHPNIGDMLSAAEPYYCEVLTNAALYSEPIMRTLENGHSNLFVSVDAGTRDTFLKAKGADMWDAVCENLEEYSRRGGRVLLKYILLPGINDTLEDADGFLALASRIHAPSISLSSNLYERTETTRLPEQTMKAAKYLLRTAKSMGIEAHLLRIFFSIHDCERILSDL